jgi:hypothetical protein
MKILAFSDIHGGTGVVEKVLRREPAADLVILAGDITTNGNALDAEEALRRMLVIGLPLVAVAGNMDPRPVEEVLRRSGVSIDARGVMFGDVGVFGVSAAPISPLRTPNEIEEEEILRRAEAGWNDLAAARWKVFVPHAPPKATRLDRIFTGQHVGSTAVRGFIENRQPDVVVCGHIHEARGMDRLGKSVLVNCGPAGRGYYVSMVIDQTITVENRSL